MVTNLWRNTSKLCRKVVLCFRHFRRQQCRTNRRPDVLSLDQLKASFRGELIQTTDPGYDMARKLYNGMIDKRPLLIAKCIDADVIAAVNFGVANNPLIAIRGGDNSALACCAMGLSSTCHA